MRLSFSAAVLFSALALLLSGPSQIIAQQSAAAIPSNLETVASPLSHWQQENQANTAAAKTSVIIEVRSVIADLDCDVPLKSFFKRGSFEVHTGSMPSIDANANVGASRISNADAPMDSTAKKATACESVRRATPVMLAKLDDKGVVKIIRALQNQKVTEAPTVICYSGQTATVSDVQLRPFVVGVKPIVGEKAVAHQPIIQTIEDGSVFRFNPTIKDGKIDLKANFVHSKVSEVQTFTFSGTESAGVTIQVPEQTLKQANVSASLDDSETLFIDPRLQVEVEQKQTSKVPFAKTKTVSVKKQVYYLITTRIAPLDYQPGASLTQAK